MKADQILRKATIEDFAKYILYEEHPPKLSTLTYSEREDEAYAAFYAQIKADHSDRNLEFAVNQLTATITEIYMEIGMKAGIQLILKSMSE